MHCPQCGRELLEGAKFCIACGAKVTVPENTEDMGDLENKASIENADLPVIDEKEYQSYFLPNAKVHRLQMLEYEVRKIVQIQMAIIQNDKGDMDTYGEKYQLGRTISFCHGFSVSSDEVFYGAFGYSGHAMGYILPWRKAAREEISQYERRGISNLAFWELAEYNLLLLRECQCMGCKTAYADVFTERDIDFTKEEADWALHVKGGMDSVSQRLAAMNDAAMRQFVLDAVQGTKDEVRTLMQMRIELDFAAFLYDPGWKSVRQAVDEEIAERVHARMPDDYTRYIFAEGNYYWYKDYNSADDLFMKAFKAWKGETLADLKTMENETCYGREDQDIEYGDTADISDEEGIPKKFWGKAKEGEREYVSLRQARHNGDDHLLIPAIVKNPDDPQGISDDGTRFFKIHPWTMRIMDGVKPWTYEGSDCIYVDGRTNINYLERRSFVWSDILAFRGMGVKEIFEEAFCHSQNLKLLLLGPKLRRVEDRAFADCPCLSHILFTGMTCDIGRDVFENSPVTVSCKENSDWHRYCMEHDIAFELV